MDIAQIKGIITRNSNDIAFLIGNGINRYFNDSPASWNDLLIDLWDKHSFNTQSVIPKGISFTEFYDALEIQNFDKKGFSADLQLEVKTIMKGWTSNGNENIVLNRIKEHDAPLLTTNFDDLIPKSMNLMLNKISDSKFTDYYPWSSYYGDPELLSPIDGFGVWYLNGMIKYHRSIKLSLSQYMNNVNHAKKMIHNRLGTKRLMNHVGWTGYPTWMNIILNKSLFVFGLGLDENEVFLRWLLIQRAKYYRTYPSEKKKGWFLMKRGGDIDIYEGKMFFLESVGFQVIVVDEYQNIYEDIWQ